MIKQTKDINRSCAKFKVSKLFSNIEYSNPIMPLKISLRIPPITIDISKAQSKLESFFFMLIINHPSHLKLILILRNHEQYYVLN